MKRIAHSKLAWIAVCAFALTAVGIPQFKQILKAGGVLVVVNNYGKEINKNINKLWGREDTPRLKTKVVPIITVGLGSNNAIGAAQVMGPPEAVDKVAAVAQPEVKILGGELRLRALIPVSTKKVIENIQAVENVGVSGIVDIKL